MRSDIEALHPTSASHLLTYVTISRAQLKAVVRIRSFEIWARTA